MGEGSHVGDRGRAPLVVEGELRLEESEGGYAPPWVTVGAERFSESLARAFGGTIGERPGFVPRPPPGGWPRVRVTVEVLE